MEPPVSSVHGILQARILEWVAVPFSGRSSWLSARTRVSCTAGKLFIIWVTREALCLSRCLSFSIFFISSWRSGDISLQFEEIHLALLVVYGLMIMNFPGSHLSENVLVFFGLYSWRVFLLTREFWIDSILDVVPFYSGLYVLWSEISNHLNFVSLFVMCNMSFFSLCFQYFLSLSFFFFCSLTIMCLGMFFFIFFPFEVCWVSWICKFMSFTKFGEISSIIFLNIGFSPFSLSSPLGILITWM